MGRVVDKDALIFTSRRRGLFQYSLETGNFAKLDGDKPSGAKVKATMSFGDVFVVNSIMEKLGYLGLFRETAPYSPDTLISYVLFRLLSEKPDSHALTWWESSFAHVLYPEAKMSSQRLSEYLYGLGTVDAQHEFLRKYISKLYVDNANCGVLIDSTGIPNDNQTYLTAINNHNGVISNESRLIYVVDKNTHMPIFYRFVPGNVVDVSTLKTTIDELKSYNISVNYSILDAGYYSENNIKYLYENNISFITRLIPNRVIYKTLVKDEVDTIMYPDNALVYNNRLMFMIRKNFILLGYTAYAYICIDGRRHQDEYLKLIQTPKFDNLTSEEKTAECKKLGLFILISTE